MTEPMCAAMKAYVKTQIPEPPISAPVAVPVAAPVVDIQDVPMADRIKATRPSIPTKVAKKVSFEKVKKKVVKGLAEIWKADAHKAKKAKKADKPSTD
jgi:hypothetical protein